MASWRISRATGYLYLGYGLARPARLPEPFRSDAPWHGTVWLLEARKGLRVMPSGPQRQKLRSILLPKTQAHPGPGGVGLDTCDVLSVTPMPNTIESRHFYIEYDAGSFGGGLTIQDYIDSLEDSWDAEVESFGWAEPPVYTPDPRAEREVPRADRSPRTGPLRLRLEHRHPCRPRGGQPARPVERSGRRCFVHGPEPGL